MSTPVPPSDSGHTSAATQMRLRHAKAQLEEVRKTDLADETPASMMLMIDRLATTIDGLLELVAERPAEAGDSPGA